ncbi:hypothetical protein PF011_g32667 [Phytophthora fragariae]|uniref:Ubiquitin-like protease family profile domain-containing protein n=1 Tax=Phytophthora fragariae TaxID=53985 RepID=A0A6A3G222_9STRA|nr:hypothetical protein PF011_g32667 [Phytophthora fragariae]
MVVAISMKHGGLRDYEVVAQNSPIQFDQFSCGVFVSWMFLRQVVQDLTHNMSENSLIQRRFELFYYILTGHLIAPINTPLTVLVDTQPPSNEGTTPIPANSDSNEDEPTDPTQPAA